MIINLQKLRAAPSKQAELEVEGAWAAEKRFGRITRGSVDWISSPTTLAHRYAEFATFRDLTLNASYSKTWSIGGRASFHRVRLPSH